MPRLAVFGTAIGAYAFVWQARRDFVLLALPMVVVIAALGAPLGWFEPWVAPARPSPEVAPLAEFDLAQTLTGTIAGILVGTIFGVAWHRRYLVPGEPMTLSGALHWRWRHTRFLLLTIAITAISLLVWVANLLLAVLIPLALPGQAQETFTAIGIVVLAMVLLIASCVLYLLIFARLSMVFPSAAVDDRMSFRDAWRLSRGNGWRIFWIFLLASVPLLLVGSPSAFALVAGDFRLPPTMLAQFAVGIVFEAVVLVSIAVGVSVLSIAYRELVAARGAPVATEST